MVGGPLVQMACVRDDWTQNAGNERQESKEYVYEYIYIYIYVQRMGKGWKFIRGMGSLDRKKRSTAGDKKKRSKEKEKER